MRSLHVASAMGNCKEVALLLDSGADVNQKRSMDDFEPLLVAAAHGRLEVVALLLERGADVNHIGIHGENALNFAVSAGHRETVKLLLKRGADVNASLAGSSLYETVGIAAINKAAHTGNHEMVKLLLDRGADIGDGCVLCKCNDTEVVRLLLQRGAGMSQWFPVALKNRPEAVMNTLKAWDDMTHRQRQCVMADGWAYYEGEAWSRRRHPHTPAGLKARVVAANVALNTAVGMDVQYMLFKAMDEVRRGLVE